MQLTKSKYVAGQQCPKMLWMEINKCELKAEQDDTAMQAGIEVGEYAKDYFKALTTSHAEVEFVPGDYKTMADETKKLMKKGVDVIFEASFKNYSDFCRVDVLLKTENGYEIIEVKSASGENERDPDDAEPEDIDGSENDEGDDQKSKKAKPVKNQYLDDMAYQYYVLNKGKNPITVSKVSLMTLNREYVRIGKLDLQSLFVLTDCTETVLQMQPDVSKNIESIKKIAKMSTEPPYPLGNHCEKPYKCGYKGWCFGDLPALNVFEIGFGMRNDKKSKLLNSGIIDFKAVSKRKIPLTHQQKLQVETQVHDLAPYVDENGIRDFLAKVSYPLYFLDFETHSSAIPPWDYTKPHQQLPYQFSLHKQESKGAEPTHVEFLAKDMRTDERKEIAELLVKHIPMDACVIAYNSGFEKARIKELSEDISHTDPAIASLLMCIRENIIDVAVPFKLGHYYCKALGGSFSIKYVLPALFPNEPKLNYKNLRRVQNGGDAGKAFATLHELTDNNEIAETREDLLEYCKLDTYATVMVLAKLYELAGA